MTFYLLSTLWKRKQPLCKFVSKHPTCEVLADKSFWASSTVISRHGFPTEYVSKAPDKQLQFMSVSVTSLLHSQEQLKRERILFTSLWVSLSRVSGELFRKQIPKRLLVLCEPCEVRGGMRGSHEGGDLRSRGDRTEVSDFRFEIKSKLKKLRAVCNDRTWGCGERAKDLWQSQLPVQLFPLYSDQGRRMVPWKTEGHKGP